MNESQRAVAPVCYGVTVWLHRMWCSQNVSSRLLVLSFLCMGRCGGSHEKVRSLPALRGGPPQLPHHTSSDLLGARVEKVPSTSVDVTRVSRLLSYQPGSSFWPTAKGRRGPVLGSEPLVGLNLLLHGLGPSKKWSAGPLIYFWSFSVPEMGSVPGDCGTRPVAPKETCPTRRKTQKSRSTTV